MRRRWRLARTSSKPDAIRHTADAECRYASMPVRATSPVDVNSLSVVKSVGSVTLPPPTSVVLVVDDVLLVLDDELELLLEDEEDDDELLDDDEELELELLDDELELDDELLELELLLDDELELDDELPPPAYWTSNCLNATWPGTCIFNTTSHGLAASHVMFAVPPG
jgi:hypothetical protein